MLVFRNIWCQMWESKDIVYLTFLWLQPNIIQGAFCICPRPGYLAGLWCWMGILMILDLRILCCFYWTLRSFFVSNNMFSFLTSLYDHRSALIMSYTKCNEQLLKYRIDLNLLVLIQNKCVLILSNLLVFPTSLAMW